MNTVTASGPVVSSAEGVDHVELALVNGGPRLAAITAAVALRRAEALDVSASMLVAHGELPEEASELERELFDVVRQTSATSARDAVVQSAGSATARRLIARLTDAGMLRDEDAARRLRSMVWALVFCWLVALALLALILAGDALALASLSAGVFSAAAAAWWLHARGGRTTGAGHAC